MSTTRFALMLLTPLALIGCPSDEPEPVDQAAQCQAACVANGHAAGTWSNGICACTDAAAPDTGQAPADTGTSQPTDGGSQPPPTDANTPLPADGGAAAQRDAGFNNHDIGVLDPDAGEMPMTRNMLCSELCQWGFSGWRDGVDGGPGEPVECPQDREAVFGAQEATACAAGCERLTAGWDAQLFVMLQDCIQTSECGARTACVPATFAANWQAPLCNGLCTGIEDYRTPATACQPPRFGEECAPGCATELRAIGPLRAAGLSRCYDNVISRCTDEVDRNACQCSAQATCHGRETRLAQRLAWQYCSLRNAHCRPQNELPTNMVDCIDRRMLEVLGHRNLPELQACLNSFEADPTNCFERLDGCLTPF